MPSANPLLEGGGSITEKKPNNPTPQQSEKGIIARIADFQKDIDKRAVLRTTVKGEREFLEKELANGNTGTYGGKVSLLKLIAGKTTELEKIHNEILAKARGRDALKLDLDGLRLRAKQALEATASAKRTKDAQTPNPVITTPELPYGLFLVPTAKRVSMSKLESGRKVSGSATPEGRQSFRLIWQAGLHQGYDIVVYPADIDPRLHSLKDERDKIQNGILNKSQQDALQTFLKYANTHNIFLSLNDQFCLVQDFSTTQPNKIAQSSQLGGNSVKTFGSGIKKITLRLSIVKQGTRWVNHTAALEALAHLSGNQSRYLGSLFLYAFDQTKPNSPREYRVTIENVTTTHSADSNSIIKVDLSFVVIHDYSLGNANYDSWGRL